MSVRIKATTRLPEMFGTIVGFASLRNPEILIIENQYGKFTVHDSEIVEFFPAN